MRIAEELEEQQDVQEKEETDLKEQQDEQEKEENKPKEKVDEKMEENKMQRGDDQKEDKDEDNEGREGREDALDRNGSTEAPSDDPDSKPTISVPSSLNVSIPSYLGLITSTHELATQLRELAVPLNILANGEGSFRKTLNLLCEIIEDKAAYEKDYGLAARVRRMCIQNELMTGREIYI